MIQSLGCEQSKTLTGNIVIIPWSTFSTSSSFCNSGPLPQGILSQAFIHTKEAEGLGFTEMNSFLSISLVLSLRRAIKSQNPIRLHFVSSRIFGICADHLSRLSLAVVIHNRRRGAFSPELRVRHRIKVALASKRDATFCTKSPAMGTAVIKLDTAHS